MELTKDVIKRFNDLNQHVFSSVKTRHPLYLNGSYRYSPWAGDIDLYCRVPIREIDKVLDILRKIDDGEEMVLHKIKIGEHKTYDRRILDDVDRVQGYLTRAKPGRRWIKGNWLLWTGSTIEEVSVVYDLGEQLSKAKITQSIRSDIAMYEAKPDLYKAMKRKRLLAKNKAPFDRIMNKPEVGLLYLCRVHAENINKAKGHMSPDKIRTARGNLRQIVRVLLGMTKIRITPNNLLKAMNDYFGQSSSR